MKSQLDLKEEENTEEKKQGEDNKKVGEFTTLSTFLRSEIVGKGIDIEKLANLVELDKEFLLNILNGNFEELPPDIYVRGYLFKLGRFLNLNPDFLWELFKKEKLKFGDSKREEAIFKSGVRRKYLKLSFWAFIILFILAIVFYEAYSSFLPPSVEIFTPSFKQVALESPLKIEGKTNAKMLRINNKPISILKDGHFVFLLNLVPGINIVKIEAWNKVGRKRIIQKVILYSPNSNLQSNK